MCTPSPLPWRLGSLRRSGPLGHSIHGTASVGKDSGDFNTSPLIWKFGGSLFVWFVCVFVKEWEGHRRSLLEAFGANIR